jgi:hypothetical protein
MSRRCAASVKMCFSVFAIIGAGIVCAKARVGTAMRVALSVNVFVMPNMYVLMAGVTSRGNRGRAPGPAVCRPGLSGGAAVVYLSVVITVAPKC